MTTRRECSKRVQSGDVQVGYRFYQCTRPATVEHGGKHYCWQHDPERVEADKKKHRAAWEAKYDRETARWKRQEHNAKLGALVTVEAVTLLERLAILAESAPSICCGLADICHGCSIRGAISQCELDEKAAIALAARIREALGVEVNGD